VIINPFPNYYIIDKSDESNLKYDIYQIINKLDLDNNYREYLAKYLKSKYN
jgi:hypothetical protein